MNWHDKQYKKLNEADELVTELPSTIPLVKGLLSAKSFGIRYEVDQMRDGRGSTAKWLSEFIDTFLEELGELSIWYSVARGEGCAL